MAKILKKILIFLAIYFIGGGIIFNHILPPKADLSEAYFNKNPTFSSKVEGFAIKVNKVENDKCHLQLILNPHAEGPPLHIHQSFDEVFKVAKGNLSIILNGEKKVLREKEQIVIPRGTPHKPFNETNANVIVMDSLQQNATMPTHFAFGLSQFYPVLDKIGDVNSPKNLLQISAQGNGFDTWLPDAPLAAQKLIRWLLGPTARLMGYGIHS